MKIEVINKVEGHTQEVSKTAPLSEADLYRHLFAWIGLLHTLRESSREECDTDVEHWRKVLLEAMTVAKSYQGDNEQLKAGFQAMLDSIHELSGFYPELTDHLLA